MGWYEAAKDAVSLAQKADNAELVQKILDVQKEALDMQEQLHKKNEEILKLKQKINSIEASKKYQYEDGKKWLIDSDKPTIKLCPTCLNRDKFESPLSNEDEYGYRYCGNCKNTVK